MARKRLSDNLINWLISFGCVVLLAVICGVCFDYYYDLNDDVLIKDLLSGAYTGTPETKNIQIYFLLSRFIAKAYSHFPKVPWYGLWLYIFQYGSIMIIINRTLKIFVKRNTVAKAETALGFVKDILLRVFTALTIALFLTGLMLEHMVNIQYTITVAYLSGAAIMWFLTSDADTTWDVFHLRNFPAIAFLFIAFLLRSEMLLLMLPLIGGAGIVKWSFEKKIFTKENFIKYLAVFVTIFFGMGIGLIANLIAFRGEDWQSFTRLFDARTELYDFQKIPSYEGNEDFYESVGLSEAEAYLFENYNYGIDKKIDEGIMSKVASYAGGLNKDSTDTIEKLKIKGRFYIYRLTHGPNDTGSDFPWNYSVIVLYLETLLLLVISKRWAQILDLVILFGLRSISWIYILMGERDPVRITHSLYFVEAMVLLGFLVLLLREAYGRLNRAKAFPVLLFTVVCLFGGFLGLNNSMLLLEEDASYREKTNEQYIELYEYTDAHPDDYFLMDVYSSVAYSERIFDSRVRLLDKRNVDLLGGWAYGSPSQKSKENRAYEDILLNEDNVFLISDGERPLDWLIKYYSEKGTPIKVGWLEDENGKAVTFGKLCIYEIGRQ